MAGRLLQTPNPEDRAGRELEWCIGFCPALHAGWISDVTYYDCTVKHIILAACEPWHGGLDSNPRYVVTHHPISWRNSPLGIHGGAPYYRIFFWWPFMALSAGSGWTQAQSSSFIPKNLGITQGLGSARHSALGAKFSKVLMGKKIKPKEISLPLKFPGICLDIGS